MPIARLSRTFLIAAYAVFAGQTVAEDRKVEDVSISVVGKSVAVTTILAEPVYQIVVAGRTTIFRTGRDVWLQFEKGERRRLASLVAVPNNVDWYEAACASGSQLMLSVASYPDAQRKHEAESALGAFRAGPKPLGVLLVDLEKRSARFWPEFIVGQKPSIPENESQTSDIPRYPERLTAGFQSCVIEGDRATLGEYSYLATVDLRNGIARILDYDLGMGLNRFGFHRDGASLWMIVTEGGFGGGHIERLASDKLEGSRLPEGNDIAPDALVRYRGSTFVSGGVAIVEIPDDRRKPLRRYRPAIDEAYLSNLVLAGGTLWYSRNEGWLRLDLDARRAVLYRPQAADLGRVHVLSKVGERWYVGTDRALVTFEP